MVAAEEAVTRFVSDDQDRLVVCVIGPRNVDGASLGNHIGRSATRVIYPRRGAQVPAGFDGVLAARRNYGDGHRPVIARRLKVSGERLSGQQQEGQECDCSLHVRSIGWLNPKVKHYLTIYAISRRTAGKPD